MQVVNHLEGHTEISRKSELYKNVKSYLEQKVSGCKVFHMMPVQFVIKFTREHQGDKISKKDIKNALLQFKQVYKLMDNFKHADLSKLIISQGQRNKIFVCDKGKELEYSF